MGAVRPLREVHAEFVRLLAEAQPGSLVFISNAVDPFRPVGDTRTGRMILRLPEALPLAGPLLELPLFGCQHHTLKPRFAFRPTTELLEEFVEAAEETGLIQALRARGDLIVVVMGRMPLLLLHKQLPTAKFVPHMSEWHHPVVADIVFSKLSRAVPGFPTKEAFTELVKSCIATPASRKQASATMRGLWTDPAFRGAATERNRANGRRVWTSQEFHEWRLRKRAQSAVVGARTLKRCWQDPAFRAKRSKVSRGVMNALWAMPEFRQAKRLWYDSEETREMMRRNGSAVLRRLREQPAFLERSRRSAAKRMAAIHADPAKKARLAQQIKEGLEKKRGTDSYWKRFAAIATTWQAKREAKRATGALAGGSSSSSGSTNAPQAEHLSCSGGDTTFHRKHDLESIALAVRQAPPGTHPVDLAHSLCIPYSNIKQYWFSRLRKDPNSDAELLQALDSMEKAAGDISRWKNNLDASRCARLWELGLSVQKISLLSEAPVFEPDVISSLGYRNSKEATRARSKFSGKAADEGESKPSGAQQKIGPDVVGAIAKEFPTIPEARIVQVCCSALHGEQVGATLSLIRKARGDSAAYAGEHRDGGTSEPPAGLRVQTTSRVSKLVEAMVQAAEQGQDKVDVRWGLCWREVQYCKVYGEACRAHKGENDLLAVLEKVHKRPDSKDKAAWKAAKAKWQAGVDGELARAMLALGFDLETVSLLCPKATRKEEVAEVLRSYGHTTSPASAGDASAAERLTTLSAAFPLLCRERAAVLAKGLDMKGRRS